MRRISVIVSLALALLVSNALWASPPETPDVTAAQQIQLINGLPGAAVAQIVGTGVDFGGGVGSLPSKATGGLLLTWKQDRSLIAGSMSHVFYRQYASTGGSETRILGAYLALHFRNGRLFSVMGTQFTAATSINQVRFSALEAVQRAHDAMAVRPGFDVEPDALLTPLEALARSSRTRLTLVSTGDGQHFRMAYVVPVSDADGKPFEVTIDAADDTVIHFHSVIADACPMPPTTIVNGTGVGQRGIRRNLPANSPGHEPGFPFDGQSGPCSSYFNCTVLQETFDPSFSCPATTYTMFPVSSVGGVATYQTSGTFRGDIATDALADTRETWDAVSAINPNFMTVGYFPGDKNILIQYTGPLSSPDDAFYTPVAVTEHLQNGGSATTVPADGVAVSPSQNLSFALPVALDVVAHEWGHLMATHNAGWPQDGATGSALQEGFADVVGQAVEKVEQPPGFGIEQSSDWSIGEDTGGGYIRSGSINDGDSGHVFAGRTVNDHWHMLEPGSEPHSVGNVLNVVFRLLAEGGQNSECGIHPEYCQVLPGVNPPTLTGIGVAKASRILMDVIIFYGYPSQLWPDIAVAAKTAASDEYSSIDPPCAATEQDQVIKAFAAVGINAGSPFC
jgi:hypothetical protein